MPLLRRPRSETGQSTANLGIVGATIACLVWAMLLLSGVDLRPGLQVLSQAAEHLVQQVRQLIER